ncbi:class C sortase [Streptococcus didelphis]|uniref:Class C sortase n=1 Tax=Streptococcus didelphis TaxID=102886 RepID=A0ABY9LJ11_9STRE|nr:class C sortase [Streptococcus didelphis]WMB28829.1 class C sortase [Streptococcus didelphis]WMB30160.1 class C sortase [Streptococcus didelphis]
MVLISLILIGIGLVSYPSLSNYWNSFHQTQAILEYQKQVTKLDTKSYEKIISNAKDYNKQFLSSGIKWQMTDKEREDYNSQLKIDQSGIMGQLNIPKINLQLPIYHGTNKSVLNNSIGHLEGTSLPVGGESTHSVLSGHRGLPSSRLFTDLDKLKIGDRWTLNILNETYTYEVDQIRTVLPKDLSNIQIEKGKDYQTLLTCTPYGVNTHRLLVRGHRVANKNGKALVVADAIQIEPSYIAPIIGLIIILILLSIWGINAYLTRQRKGVLKEAKSSVN